MFHTILFLRALDLACEQLRNQSRASHSTSKWRRLPGVSPGILTEHSSWLFTTEVLSGVMQGLQGLQQQSPQDRTELAPGRRQGGNARELVGTK